MEFYMGIIRKEKLVINKNVMIQTNRSRGKFVIKRNAKIQTNRNSVKRRRTAMIEKSRLPYLTSSSDKKKDRKLVYVR